MGLSCNILKRFKYYIVSFLKYFSLKDNGFKCNECGRIDKSAIEMNESTKNAIKFILTAPAKKIYSFNLYL